MVRVLVLITFPLLGLYFLYEAEESFGALGMLFAGSALLCFALAGIAGVALWMSAAPWLVDRVAGRLQRRRRPASHQRL